jgi:hypothetical protein
MDADETLEACPTDVVRGSVERVWEHLTDPARLGWVAKVIEAPAGRLRAGDRLRFAAAPGMRVTWDVRAVEAPRQLALDVALPFGMGNRMTIVVSPIDAASCRVTFN